MALTMTKVHNRLYRGCNLFNCKSLPMNRKGNLGIVTEIADSFE